MSNIFSIPKNDSTAKKDYFDLSSCFLTNFTVETFSRTLKQRNTYKGWNVHFQSKKGTNLCRQFVDEKTVNKFLSLFDEVNDLR